MAGTRAHIRALAAVLVMTPPAALADPGIADLQALLAAQGGQVTRHDRAAGDPYLDVVTGGFAWRAYFNECAAPPRRACRSVSLRIGFAHARLRDLAAMNEWNQSHLFGRALLEGDGTPSLAEDLALTGVEAAAVAAFLQRWQTDIQRFHEFVEREPEP